MNNYPQPLVSVVMPSLNQAMYINSAIDSVLNQRYEKLELIVVDGGSTDESIEILSKRGSLDPRIKWTSEKDSGPADALNKGFAKAKGTIIGWLNSDDLYTEGAIRRATDALLGNNDLVMVYGQGQHVDSSGEIINTYPTKLPSTPTSSFRDGCFICQPTMFFKRTVNVLLGDLDTSLKTAFDFDYWLRAFHAFEGRIGFVDKVQAYSRLHDDCITIKMRQTVAVEGMRVIATHLGDAPGHWLLTYINELISMPESERKINSLRDHILETFDDVCEYMTPQERENILLCIQNDARLDVT